MTAHNHLVTTREDGVRGSSWLPVLLLISLLVWFGLSAVNLYYGELNQDEGWYLYAARLAAEGHQPYRDFAFTQGPVFTTVYAWAQPTFARYGLMGGRIITGLLGLVAVLMGGVLAARLTSGPGARSASAIAVILLLCNVYHSYFSLVVKTYSLCAVFIMAGALCLTGKKSDLTARGALCGGLFFALAAGVRLSAGVWLPVAGLYLLWRRREYKQAWIYFGVGGVAGLLLAFGPSLIRAPQETLFWLVQYHAARDAGVGWGGLVYKAGFVSRFVQAYFVPSVLLLILVVLAWTRNVRNWVAAPAGMLWCGAIVLSFVHLAAPFPYEDYQVFIMPLFAALIAFGGVRMLQSLVPDPQQRFAKRTVVLLVLLASVAAALSSPLNQAWVLRERDRIWWRLKEQPDLVLLQQTAQWLNEQRGDDDLLLTQDTYLAVETGMRVPAGLEMGAFSYYPDWTREDAERRRVLNRDMMKELLKKTDASWAAFSGYGWAIRSPDVAELSAEEQAALRAIVERRYARVKQVPHFGQAHTTLEIWSLLNPEP